MISVIATIELKADQRDALVVAFKELMPLVHAEAGCVEYFPTIDVDSGIDVQQDVRPNAVTILEKWESLEALKVHLDAPHMHAFRDKVSEMVTSLTLQIVEPA